MKVVQRRTVHVTNVDKGLVCKMSADKNKICIKQEFARLSLVKDADDEPVNANIISALVAKGLFNTGAKCKHK